MANRNKLILGGISAGIVSTLLVALFFGLIVVYTGGYNVAATQDHSPFFRWAFTTTMQNSIESRSAEISAPEFFDETMIAAGAREYSSMCQHCHGGPGIEQAEWARGMLPQPPHLTEAASEWKAEEIFWIVKHGIKTTGMPAFGSTHDDKVLWNIAAFVQRLPGMTNEQYASIGGEHSVNHTH